MEQLKGTGIALVTPFLDGAVDYDGLRRVINHTIEGGVEYLISLGTTGETPTLSVKEQKTVLEFTIEVINKRVPLVAGFGGNNTAQIVEDIKSFHFKGVDAILSSSPNYNKPTQEGIFQHYMAIAEVAPCPIIVYNVPGRTSRNMTAATTLRLANASDKFVAIKEASGDFEQCMEIIKNRPKGFLVLSGDDTLTLPLISCGAEGVISVVGNAYPKIFSDMVRYCNAGNFEAARPLHYDLFDVTNLMFAECNPAGVKGSLEILGLCSKEVRLPIVEITSPTYKLLQEENKKLEKYFDLA